MFSALLYDKTLFFLSAAAILLLTLDELVTPDHVISKLRQIRGQRAFQTVKVRAVSQFHPFNVQSRSQSPRVFWTAPRHGALE